MVNVLKMLNLKNRRKQAEQIYVKPIIKGNLAVLEVMNANPRYDGKMKI